MKNSLCCAEIEINILFDRKIYEEIFRCHHFRILGPVFVAFPQHLARIIIHQAHEEKEKKEAATKLMSDNAVKFPALNVVLLSAAKSGVVAVEFGRNINFI